MERRQAWLLAVFAAVVAFAAVFGAWQVASRWVGGSESPGPAGRLVLITLRGASAREPVAALLAVRNAGTGRCSAYTIPAELLLEGPGGEYVFAGDAMAAGTLRDDLQRVVKVPVDAAYSLPASALTDLAGGEPLRLVLERPLEAVVDGARRRFKPGDQVRPGEFQDLLAAAASKEAAGATLQAALVRAALSAGAARPAGEAADAAARVAAGAAADAALLQEMLKGLVTGDATVARLPSTTRVAEGQFAFVPDAEAMMADVTRNSPAFRAEYTVVVRNGTGAVGAGGVVARRLAGLDVNLAPVGNAATFGYRHTQILAGERALPVAQDIRAILGRGVVLDGTGVPAKTVVVIVGADLILSELTPKDQP